MNDKGIKMNHKGYSSYKGVPEVTKIHFKTIEGDYLRSSYVIKIFLNILGKSKRVTC